MAPLRPITRCPDLVQGPKLRQFTKAFQWVFDQPYLLLSLTMLFWSGNVVLGRAIVGTVPPITLAQIRWTGAAILLLPFAWPHLRRDWPVIKTKLPILMVLAFAGITTYNTLAYIGLQYTTAINGLLMQSAAPLIIGFWSLILFRDALNRFQLAGVTLSLMGVLVILTQGDLSALSDLRFNRGDLFVLTAFLFYAFYSSILRKKPPLHWLSFLWVTICLGALLLSPAFLWEWSQGLRPVLSAGSFSAFIYVILVASVAAYICFNRGVELIGANRAGPFFHLMPLFGSVLAILFLDERFALFHLFGYGLILAGVVLAQRRLAHS